MTVEPEPFLTIDPLVDKTGHCDCCGHESRLLTGMVYAGGDPLAVYRIHWTVDRLDDGSADLDLVIGKWGDGASSADRFAVSLKYRREPDGGSSVMVVDATDSPMKEVDLADTFLLREDVIGTPFAPQLFAITDAICDLDLRFR